MTPTPVLVEWADTGEYRGGEWATGAEHAAALAGPDRELVRTVGYLMHEDEDRLLVALNYDKANDQYLGVQCINIQAVQYMARLEVPR